MRCPTGAARLTPGFGLPASWVIHTVGPVWRGGAAGEPDLLAACYREALRLAAVQRLASLAFPAISCGIYGYPPEEASRIAVREARAWLAAQPAPRSILFCCFNAGIAGAWRAALAEA